MGTPMGAHGMQCRFLRLATLDAWTKLSTGSRECAFSCQEVILCHRAPVSALAAVPPTRTAYKCHTHIIFYHLKIKISIRAALRVILSHQLHSTHLSPRPRTPRNRHPFVPCTPLTTACSIPLKTLKGLACMCQAIGCRMQLMRQNHPESGPDRYLDRQMVQNDVCATFVSCTRRWYCSEC
jgi:hypothetical protein